MPTEKPVFKLKNIFNQEVLKSFAQSVKQHWVLFPTDSFLNLVFDETWEDLELKERMRHISSSLKNVLPENYEEAVNILVATTKSFISDQGEKMLFEHSQPKRLGHWIALPRASNPRTPPVHRLAAEPIW